MIFIWKGKGLLVVFYVILSFMITIILFGLLCALLKIDIDNFDIENYFGILFSISLILAGLWTLLTCEDYVKIDGKRKKMESDHRLFFIKMKHCGYILLVSGIGLLIFNIIYKLIKILI